MTDGGNRLAEWRATAGEKRTRLTQQELAERLSVTQSTIAHIEAGEAPGLDLAVRIEELTGIEPSAFLRTVKRKAG